MITEISTWQEWADQAKESPAVDEGKCTVNIACGNEAWIGPSSEGEFRMYFILSSPHDGEAPPVLACEDCMSWLEEVLDK